MIYKHFNIPTEAFYKSFFVNHLELLSRWVTNLIQEKGMKTDQISYGYWCNGDRTRTSQYQDFVIFSLAN